MLDRPALFLLETYGALAIGWVIAALLAGVIIALFRWFAREQRAWRETVERRAAAYHEVVKENTQTTAKQAVVFEERTRALLEYMRDRPRS